MTAELNVNQFSFPDKSILPPLNRDIASSANCKRFLVREDGIIKIGRANAGSGANTIQLDSKWPVTGQAEGIQGTEKQLFSPLWRQ